jgi:hypothetical protein
MIGFVKKVFGITKVESNQNSNETNATSIASVEQPAQNPPSNLKKGACDCDMCGCLCGSEDCTVCC